MQRLLACMAVLAVLCAWAPARAATITTVAAFTDTGAVPVGGGVMVDGFGGASAAFLEYSGDFLSWSHTFMLPGGESVVSAVLSITLRDDADDSLDYGYGFVFEQPDYGYALLDDGQLVFSGELLQGVLSFDIAVASLADGVLGVRVGSFGGDMFVAESSLRVTTSPALQPVPLPAALGLLAGSLGTGALLMGRRFVA